METSWDLGAIIGAAVAIIVSFYVLYRTTRISSYADLDLLYLEFLQVGIEHPRFTDPSLTKDYQNGFQGDEFRAYDVYAFMSWNICETIYDRCKGVKQLWHTWEPVIVAENRLHRRWFDNPDNFHKFKEEFREYIEASYPKDYPAEEDMTTTASSKSPEE